MSTSKKIVDVPIGQLLIFITILILIILSSININNYLKPIKNKVLGMKTEDVSISFWFDFLNKNPNYIPGWVEIGRTDKAIKIDPNFRTGTIKISL